MRMGQPSVSNSAIDDDAINHNPEELQDDLIDNAEPFAMACYFARLCSFAMRQLYTREGQMSTTSRVQNIIEMLRSYLTTWNEMMPTISYAASPTDSRALSLQAMKIRSFELLLCTNGFWFSRPDGCEDVEIQNDCSRTILKSAEEVLSLLIEINPQVVRVDWY
ncbi:hypothetical protein NX059_002697 [Plenodomus lindquistii]|nr:hypothetical protein NX059_002697 [Plenodomus lindquistii]